MSRFTLKCEKRLTLGNEGKVFAMFWSINRKSLFSLLAILCMTLGFAGGYGNLSPVEAQTTSPLDPAEEILAGLYERVSPSIVAINIMEPTGNDFEVLTGGSGFVLDRQGHILTNFHVIDVLGRDGRIEVYFVDGTIVEGEIVGIDADSDLAIVKVDLPVEQLTPLPFADSDDIVVGQTTIAIGSPFGQNWTMTTGIISALDRTIAGLNTYQVGSVIQTDAAINPGNSGGPLLNLQGQVIGVTSQIISQERANSGVGFAVPSNLASRVARLLIDQGSVDYAFLGIAGEDVDLRDMERLNLSNNTRGVVVNNYSPIRTVSPAREGGVQIDDVIIAIDDRQIVSFGSLIGYLATSTEPGQTVRITVLRGGQPTEILVELGSRRGS
jgi:S1-C subfamily serine protease